MKALAFYLGVLFCVPGIGFEFETLGKRIGEQYSLENIRDVGIRGERIYIVTRENLLIAKGDTVEYYGNPFPPDTIGRADYNGQTLYKTGLMSLSKVHPLRNGKCLLFTTKKTAALFNGTTWIFNRATFDGKGWFGKQRKLIEFDQATESKYSRFFPVSAGSGASSQLSIGDGYSAGYSDTGGVKLFHKDTSVTVSRDVATNDLVNVGDSSVVWRNSVGTISGINLERGTMKTPKIFAGIADVRAIGKCGTTKRICVLTKHNLRTFDLSGVERKFDIKFASAGEKAAVANSVAALIKANEVFGLTSEGGIFHISTSNSKFEWVETGEIKLNGFALFRGKLVCWNSSKILLEK